MSLQGRIADLINAIGEDYKRSHGVVSAVTNATLTPSASSYQFNITAQAGDLTIAAPTGSPIDGQSMMIRLKDDGTARAISWDAAYRPIEVTLPLTTTATKTLYVGAKWNDADSVWDVLAVGQEA